MLLFRTNIPIVNGISGPTTTEACSLILPKDTTIADLKFLDERALLILCHTKGTPEIRPARGCLRGLTGLGDPTNLLIRIAYQSPGIPYRVYRQGATPKALQIVTQKEHSRFYLTFGIAKMPTGFTPIQMEVQAARKSRGDIPARVCLLGRDKAMVVTYALPEDWETAMGQLTLKEERDVSMLDE